MRTEEFERICQSVESGGEMRVRHIVLHQTGKVVACHPDDFVEVELDSGEHKTWSRDNVKLLQ
jgi:hypothetical protein